ncbi:MAG: hypothetical protein U9R25_19670 [Chloroflexota bacterium]|nr:hypothetical protein [Chloroflexota bacterium]
MTRKFSKLAIVGYILMLLILATAVTSASPDAVTFNTMTAECPVPSATASDIDVVITAQGVVGELAGYEIELEYDFAVLTLDGVTAGADMTAMGCSFNTQVGFENSPYAWITGSCTAGAGTYASGDVELVVAHFSYDGAPGSYPILLTTTGVGVPTALLDPTGAATAATVGQLVQCEPTAVEMSEFSASPAASALSLWPLLAGSAAIAAGGAYALMRRKR